jgi:hypothetical protein
MTIHDDFNEQSAKEAKPGDKFLIGQDITSGLPSGLEEQLGLSPEDVERRIRELLRKTFTAPIPHVEEFVLPKYDRGDRPPLREVDEND